METTRYSTVIEQPIQTVWTLIRDFNNYPAYIDSVTDSVLEDGRAGDEVGAKRRFCYSGNWIRQRLGAHSDEQHLLTYIGLDPFVFPEGIVPNTPPPADYEGTMQLTDIGDERTKLDWSVSVDAGADHKDSWHDLLTVLIEGWAAALKATLARSA